MRNSIIKLIYNLSIVKDKQYGMTYYLILHSKLNAALEMQRFNQMENISLQR